VAGAELATNPDAWDRLEDGVTRVTALRAGEVDFVNWVPREHAKRLEQDAKIQLWRGPETTGVFLVPTLSRTPWDDLRVRRAVMGYGLDRECEGRGMMRQALELAIIATARGPGNPGGKNCPSGDPQQCDPHRAPSIRQLRFARTIAGSIYRRRSCR